MPPKSSLGPSRPGSEPVWGVRTATEADCRYLAPRLCKGSLEEMAALSKYEPLTVLLKDLENKAVIYDNRYPARPVAILETTPVKGTKTIAIWSALTDRIIHSEQFWSFTIYAADILNRLHQGCTLKTYVDRRNLRLILWLERIGFTLVEEVPQYGVKEYVFLLYKRVQPNV